MNVKEPSMTEEEVQRQIALITGKMYEKNTTRVSNDESTNDNVSGCNKESKVFNQDEFSGDDTEDTSDEVEDESNRNVTGRNTPPESNKSVEHVEYSSEIKTYLELFKATEVRNNKILDGRDMTRKEYLKYTKHLSKQEVLNHPLMYRMFRSEEQMEGNFHSWLDQFEE